MNIPMSPDRHFVLVVDADARRGRALQSELRAAGCYASWEPSGADALRYVLENEPDAVVADWTLPDLGGPELCRRIKSERFETKVILGKMGVDWRDLRQAFEAAADDVLPRPLGLGELLASLERPDPRAKRACLSSSVASA